MSGHDREMPPELAEVGERLRAAKPRLSPLELDRVTANTMRMKGNDMKARFTILTALVVGILMMGTGGAIAVNGLSAGSTAAEGQYGPVKPAHDGGGSGGVLGAQDDSCGSGSSNGSAQSGSSGSGSEACSGAIPHDAQATRQVESSGSGTLPFTGFLAIPVLLVGVGLVGSGVVLRRRLSAE